MFGDPKKCGWMCIILGLLVLLNQHYFMWNWWTFIGVIFVLKGIFLMSCSDSLCSMPTKRRR
ncbi:MAG TPA: hypothetical protein VJG90_04685 [Candidatus Nanoarchaeia archaeon]|nr:hypothetical protein [Candidatus Nanoarchaeia archaeon]